jgi:hypothetical protein
VSSPNPSRKLSLADISDVRAYERERPDFRERILELRRRRRIGVGTMITVSFESRETIRYQIQEMARVEKLMTDDDIQAELDTYNPLIPEPGMLCATLFIELTSDDSVREWLPKLVGIERHVVVRLGDGSQVRSAAEQQHARQLTRPDATSAVHYLQFEFSPEHVAALAAGAAELAIDHPAYLESTPLLAATIDELLADLRASAPSA